MRETPVKRKEKREKKNRKKVSFLFLCTCGIGWRSTPLCVAAAMTLPVFCFFFLVVLFPAAPARSLTPNRLRCGIPIYRCQVSLTLTHWLLLFIVPLFIFLSTHPCDKTGKVQSPAHFLTTFQTTFTSVSPGRTAGWKHSAFLGVF